VNTTAAHAIIYVVIEVHLHAYLLQPSHTHDSIFACTIYDINFGYYSEELQQTPCFQYPPSNAKQVAVTCSNNAKSCYNQIVHCIAAQCLHCCSAPSKLQTGYYLHVHNPAITLPSHSDARMQLRPLGRYGLFGGPTCRCQARQWGWTANLGHCQQLHGTFSRKMIMEQCLRPQFLVPQSPLLVCICGHDMNPIQTSCGTDLWKHRICAKIILVLCHFDFCWQDWDWNYAKANEAPADLLALSMLDHLWHQAPIL